MIEYRIFRNTDPPGLVQVWNEAFAGRSAACLANANALEYYVFSKLYFDRAGLIEAWDDGTLVGFAHAGFGANESGSALMPTDGVTCLLAVRPTHRRHGIGSELLKRCENYLRERGASKLFAGAANPRNPFYFGLYGGSNQPGFLASDQAVEPFLKRHGYQPLAGSSILQRRLQQTPSIVDGRFSTLRKQFDFRAGPRADSKNWWRESVLGPLEPVEFQLVNVQTGQVAARAVVWEMEGFCRRWNQMSAGIINLHVEENQRRRGLAKFLLAQLLKHLQEQYFGLVEVQIPENSEAASRLFKGIGFEQVDVGHVYQKAA